MKKERITLHIEKDLVPIFQEKYGRTMFSKAVNAELRRIKEAREQKVQVLEGELEQVQS